MEIEKVELTNWKSKEKEVDRVWINENYTTLQHLVLNEYDKLGKGAIFINTTEYSENKGRHPCYYLTQATIKELENDETINIVGEYKPSEEFIIVFLKEGNPERVHRVSFQMK